MTATPEQWEKMRELEVFCREQGEPDSANALRAVLADSEALAQLEGPVTALDLPRWKCRQCGCLWRDNLDGTVSLFDAEQRSCQHCEMLPTAEACVIEWFKAGAETQP